MTYLEEDRATRPRYHCRGRIILDGYEPVAEAANEKIARELTEVLNKGDY